MSEQGRLCEFHAPKQPFQMTTRDVPEPKPGAVVVKVTTCNICGSDVHAWNGDFKTTALGGKLPTVLGHEMIGEVAALGEGVTKDSNGQPLAVGDRVTYTYFSACGKCPNCLIGRQVACHNLTMAMLGAAEEWPHFVGGYADYFYVNPGSTIYKVAEDIPDELAAGANCALSQVLYGFQRAGLTMGDTVVIQGAGGLGIYAAAVAREFGASTVIVLDAVDERLDLARRFGAHHVINIADIDDPRARAKEVRRLTGGRGGDVVMELVGRPEAVPEGIGLTAMLGRYVIIGNINYGLTYEADPSRLVMANKTMIGVSLYTPAVLGQALSFIERTKNKYPYKELLSHKYPLEKINDAFDASIKRQVARASIVL